MTELETVALVKDLPEHRLVTGDIGTVVHVYPAGETVEVEFSRADGTTVAVVTLRSDDLRRPNADVRHERPLHS